MKPEGFTARMDERSIELKLDASAKHVSQRGAAQRQYAPEMTPEEKEALLTRKEEAKGQKHIEHFRRGGTSY